MASTKRERELARQRAERQAARRAAAEAARKRRRAAIAASVAVVVAVAALVGLLYTQREDKPDQLDQAAAPPAAGACTFSPAGQPARPVGLPPQPPASPPAEEAVLTTTQGEVRFRLLTDKAPCTTTSFRHLAASGFYDGTPCPRLSGGSLAVLQCGDPTGTGSGGPGYEFANENTEGATYERGTVAMANAGPDTNGSQFFLVYGDSQLSPDYTVFGEITSGLDVLDKVAKAGDDGTNPAGGGKPKLPIDLTKVTVVPANSAG